MFLEQILIMSKKIVVVVNTAMKLLDVTFLICNVVMCNSPNKQNINNIVFYFLTFLKTNFYLGINIHFINRNVSLVVLIKLPRIYHIFNFMYSL